VIGADAVAGWALGLAAPIIGSFLGVLVQRLPEGEAIVWSRSRCELCGTVLAPRDLVPLLGWLAARGRCRHCGVRLGWFYPGIEIAAVLVALAALAIDDMPRAGLDCVFGWGLLALGWIDLRCWLLPDALTLPLLAIGIAEAAAYEPDSLLDRMLGVALGYLLLRLIAILYRVLRGQEGLGGGDAKLLAATGAWVGAGALPQVILGAAVAGLAAAAAMQLAGRRLHARSALPFGPFLGLAAWLVWLWQGW
jgi:leader peptidase (prepilin peptidase)/N-methyltransferase